MSKSILNISYLCLINNLKTNNPEQILVLLLIFKEESSFLYFKVLIQ